MAKRLKVYDDYYINAMFEDTRIHTLYYRSDLNIEYGQEGYVLIFLNVLRQSSLYAPFIKHGISIVIENEEGRKLYTS